MNLNIAHKKLNLLMLIYVTLFAFVVTPLHANYQYHYTRISTNVGLSNSAINSIYRDHNNTLWIGTLQGLNHLNGYEVNSYYTTSGSSSVPSNNILFVTGSSSDEVIVSTQNGVVRYMHDSDSFEYLICEGDIITADIYCNTKENLYLISSRGIYIYNNDGTCSLCFDLRGRNKHKSRFNSIVESNVEGLFFIGTRHDGLWQIDINRGTLERVEWYPYDSVVAMSKGEGSDNFWITPYNTGVFNYSMRGELLSYFNAQNSELKDNLTLALSVIGEKLFVGSNGNGIYIVDIPSKRLNSIGYNTLYEPSISTAKCFSNSRSADQVWVGSLDDGVFDLSSVSIRAYGKAMDYSSESLDRLGLSSRSVNYMLKDGDKVWIATDGGGINRFDPKRRTFRHYPSTESLKVVSIVKWSPYELLLSVYSRGLFIFDIRNGSIRSVLDQEYKRYMSPALPVNLLLKGDKLYMFGNKGAVYDRNSHEISALPLVELPYPSPMTPIHLTDSTAYIISKRVLYELEFDSGRIESIYTPDIEGSFINSAVVDDQNRVWIGHDDGVLYYDLNSGEVGIEQELQHLRVNAVAISSSGKYWIGAENTLYRYNRETNHLQSYNTQIGFSPNAFKGKASLTLNNGDLLMAGASGVVVIPYDIKPIDPSPLRFVVDRIIINGEVMDQDIWRADENKVFKIPNSNVVQLALKHDNENLFYQYKFRYYINGEFFVESDDNTLNLGSLNGGSTYDLSVAYLDIDDNWSEPQQLISFRVPIAWYLQWYSILLFSSIIAAIILWQIHRYRIAEINQYHQQLSDHLKRISEEKIEFLTNINHELRTPLTLMRAPLMQVANSLPEDSDESRLSKLALKQVMRMKYIVDMILDINKIDSGSKILYKTAVNVDVWLLDFVSNFEYESQQHHVKIVVTHDDEFKQTMLDRGKIELVITNLISNAIKFSPENSTIAVHSSISERERIRICVKDQGVGIKGDPNMLFDAFYQENVNGIGTGLGLSYARSIVELHDGEIGCENNLGGEGANFYFEIPIVECSEEDLNISSPKSKIVEDIAEADLSQYVAVIVEDDQSVREYLMVELRKRFKSVNVAVNGLDGLQLIRKVKPDIVISDVMMPVMSGFELCQTLKNESEISHIPVILLTAYVGQDNKLTGYKVGADNYITKPFDMEYLVAVLGNTLSYRHQVRSRSKSSSGIIDSKEATFSPYDERFMIKVNSVVERELSNPQLNVDMVASAVAMSRTSLYNKMKSVADVSVRDYILRIRMERARDLLSTPDMPIADVAAQVGFTDQRYFSTIFKQYHKQTPSEYRKSNL
ncbi:MAG: response regulator [Rikenellaceae bacterium]